MMTNPVEYLRNYPCVCKYGTSPTKCSDETCEFRQAILALRNQPSGGWERIKTGVSVYKYRCLNCGFISHSGIRKFCPECGAPSEKKWENVYDKQKDKKGS